MNVLEGLPDESEHCALLAVNTLKAAIKDCITIKKVSHGRRPTV